MGYPWPLFPRTPEQIWAAADRIEDSAGDYENLSTNVWKAHKPASEGVAGTISGPINQYPPDERRHAFSLICAALVGGAATRHFGDAVLIFNQEVEELNSQFENARDHDYYGHGRSTVEHNLNDRYLDLEGKLDDEARDKKTLLAKDTPSEADIKLLIDRGAMPPGAAAAFPQYDLSDVPEFAAWQKGYEFPRTGDLRRTLMTFFGPGVLGAQQYDTQVGEPGPDRGIIFGRFFISKNDAAWPADLLGDNRDFTSDPDADYRIAFAYNTATGEMTYRVGGSTETDGTGMDARDFSDYELPWTNTRPDVSVDEDGLITIDVHAVNPQTPAGAVDEKIIISPTGDGAYISGNDYPDVEFYRRNPDGTVTDLGTDTMSSLDGMATLLPPFNRTEYLGDAEDWAPPPPTGCGTDMIVPRDECPIYQDQPDVPREPSDDPGPSPQPTPTG
ncbi:hypothetical protein [Solicola gregarius]|uniref:Uncharacterized protein n=1 Tax=Solicola gregarius TaxID=2908642 RepID=A0AA46TER7_9ACTN|nr:hypothetical protein [Solicola gregarius]UYM03467.1 hypothetical protein L0C25_12960 [Solicola gregarius]